MTSPTWRLILRNFALILGSLLWLTVQAHAVEPRVYRLENGGGVAPHVTLEVAQDSNPLRNDAGSEESLFVRLRPEVTYLLERRNNRLSIGYSGDYFQYLNNFCSDPVTAGFFSVNRPGDCQSDASPEFNKASYQDHSIRLRGFLEISRRARASVGVSTELVNQPLGTGLSATQSVLTALEQPDSLVRNSARIDLSYGASQARGELRFSLNLIDRNYRENAGRSLSALDERSVEPIGSLLYRIGSRTQVFAGLGHGGISGGNAQRTISRQFVGVEFGATAITSGTVRLSAVEEDFDDPGREDLTFGGFDIDLTWRPRRFSTVRVGGGRGTERATLSEGVAITTGVDINWQHFWRDRFSTMVELAISRNESDQSTEQDNDANDRTNRVRLGALYNVRRWLDIGAFAESETRQGVNIDGDSRDFSRTVIGLTANGTF